MPLLTCASLLALLFCAQPHLSGSEETLKEMILPNSFMIPAEKVEEITLQYNLKTEELLQRLVPIAASRALPPISNYKVGIAVLGNSGAIYLGVNLEFLGVPLNQSVHGEQFAIANARKHGESGLAAIALSAAPCGHCRQFMGEIGGIENMQIFTPHADAVLFKALLPSAFGPEDLGLSGHLLAPHVGRVCDAETSGSTLRANAYRAALHSYAPYSQSRSGIAIRTKERTIYSGSYLENAAFNPSLSPLQDALVSLVADGRGYDEIAEVFLMEELPIKAGQELMTREILKNIAPQAIFQVDYFQ